MKPIHSVGEALASMLDPTRALLFQRYAYCLQFEDAELLDIDYVQRAVAQVLAVTAGIAETSSLDALRYEILGWVQANPDLERIDPRTFWALRATGFVLSAGHDDDDIDDIHHRFRSCIANALDVAGA